MHTHFLAAAHAAAKTSTGSEIFAGIVIVIIVAAVLLLFGWRPVRSRTVSESPAANAVRTTGRAGRKAGRKVAARTRKPAVQPDDAA